MSQPAITQVKRLTASESAREQQLDYDRIPEKARIKWICQYLNKSDRCVARYRKILFQTCLEYQCLTCINGIDSNVLTRRQIQLLEEFANYADLYRNIDLATSHYGSNHPKPF
jgi:predicted DNA-binding helix-hairpin-helix protein